MSDDAEFDAFLKGEDALSRRLQAMPQAAPSAELDAAILQRARDMMAQESRPAAANDAGEGKPAPRLGRLSWRWRVPAGIAATVLTGVFAQHAFQSSVEMESRVGMPVEENVLIMMPAPSVVAPAADLQVAVPPPPPPPPAPAPKVSMPEFKSAAPAPAPVVEMPAPAAPAAEPMQRVEVTGSAVKRADAESSMPTTVMERAPEAPPAPAPAPMPASVAANKPMAPAASAAPSGRLEYSLQRQLAQDRARADQVSKAAKDGDRRKGILADRAPADWLAEIEAMLGTGKDKELLEAWRQFRKAHPDYPVPETTAERIKAIEK